MFWYHRSSTMLATTYACCRWAVRRHAVYSSSHIRRRVKNPGCQGPVRFKANLALKTAVEKDENGIASEEVLSEKVDAIRKGRNAKRSSDDVDAYGHPRIPLRGHYDLEKCDARRQWVEKKFRVELPHTGQWWRTDCKPPASTNQLRGNIENVVGLTTVPIGIAGPLLLRGDHVCGYVVVPYATTEGALVASATRGATAIMRSGGARVRALEQRIGRVPCFQTRNLDEAVRLADWLRNHVDEIRENGKETSQHTCLLDIEPCVIGRSVYAYFRYTTGDAAGQNMVTSMTWKACRWALEKLRREEKCIRVEHFYIETKMSSDKTSAQLCLMRTRGTASHAEVYVPESVLRDTLKVSSDELLTCWNHIQISNTHIGVQGSNINVINAVTAIFIATGQDVAAAVESAGAQLTISRATPEQIAHYRQEGIKLFPEGVARPEKDDKGGIYMSLTMPTLVVGTVGGGTCLPTQKEALQMLGCQGKGGVKRLAEIVCGSSLGLDLSTLAALASGQFASAHDKLGRNRPDLGLKQSHLNENLFAAVVKPFGQLVSFSLSTVDASASILSDLSKTELSKLVGHVAYDITYRPKGSDKTDVLRTVMKSKATYKETCNMLNKLAQGCGLDLATQYEFYKMRTGFQNCDERELMVLSITDERFLSISPKTYYILKDADKDLFAYFMENFDYMEHVHTGDDPSCWTDDDIKLVLRDVASFHSIFYGNVEPLLEQPWIVPPTAEDMVEMMPLWQALFNHNSDEFPSLWTAARGKIVHGILNNLGDIWEQVEAAPRTLVHNDFNPRNICINPGNGGSRRRLCAYDWELATVNVPQRDVAELLSFLLPENATAELRRSYVNYHRQELEKVTGQAINAAEYQHMFDLISCDLAINRLALYSMAHTFKDYQFFPRVLACHFNYLTAVAAKGELTFRR